MNRHLSGCMALLLTLTACSDLPDDTGSRAEHDGWEHGPGGYYGPAYSASGYYGPGYYGPGYYGYDDDDWYVLPPGYYRPPGQQPKPPKPPEKPARPDRPGAHPENPIANVPEVQPRAGTTARSRERSMRTAPSIPSRARPTGYRSSGMRGGGGRGGRRR